MNRLDFKEGDLVHFANILFEQYTILRDDKFQHGDNHYRRTQFDAGVNYYQVDKMNGVIMAISKSKAGVIK